MRVYSRATATLTHGGPDCIRLRPVGESLARGTTASFGVNTCTASGANKCRISSAFGWLLPLSWAISVCRPPICRHVLAKAFGDRLTMIRVVLPGAILIACVIGGCAISLWVLFHSQFQSNWRPEQAFAGDVPAQRRLAKCYMTGCSGVPRDPAFGCAWRTIISDDEKQPSPSDLSAARQACSKLSASDRRWITTLESDIRSRMHEDKHRSNS